MNCKQLLHGYRPYRVLIAALLCVVIFAAPFSSHADVAMIEDGGAFDVRSAYLEPLDHTYYLNATLDLALAKNAEQALSDGVPIVFNLEFQLLHQRRFLPDERLVSVSQRWRLQYHALSGRYLVVDLSTNQQSSYANRQAAIAALSDIHMLPIIEDALIHKGTRYDASVRVTTLVEGGLPNSLRAVMFWVDWKHTTEWYTWTVAI